MRMPPMRSLPQQVLKYTHFLYIIPWSLTLYPHAHLSWSVVEQETAPPVSFYINQLGRSIALPDTLSVVRSSDSFSQRGAHVNDTQFAAVLWFVAKGYSVGDNNLA
jgi:hypothetical protein